jgi:hypothetical protein
MCIKASEKSEDRFRNRQTDRRTATQHTTGAQQHNTHAQLLKYTEHTRSLKVTRAHSHSLFPLPSSARTHARARAHTHTHTHTHTQDNIGKSRSNCGNTYGIPRTSAADAIVSDSYLAGQVFRTHLCQFCFLPINYFSLFFSMGFA